MHYDYPTMRCGLVGKQGRRFQHHAALRKPGARQHKQACLVLGREHGGDRGCVKGAHQLLGALPQRGNLLGACEAIKHQVACGRERARPRLVAVVTVLG